MARTNVITMRRGRLESPTHDRLSNMFDLDGNLALQCIGPCATCEERCNNFQPDEEGHCFIEVRDVDMDGNCVLIGFIDAQTITPDFGNGDEQPDDDDDDEDDEDDATE